jgi:hypothetical protein
MLTNLTVDPCTLKGAAASDVETVIVVRIPPGPRAQGYAGCEQLQFMNRPADVRVRIFTIGATSSARL